MSCKCTWTLSPHATYGDCLRSKNIRTAPSATPSRSLTPNNTHRSADEIKAFERRLDNYASARRQGILPEGTGVAAVDNAVRQSESTGVAYDANYIPSPESLD